jgi:hypothetical protein
VNAARPECDGQLAVCAVDVSQEPFLQKPRGQAHASGVTTHRKVAEVVEEMRMALAVRGSVRESVRRHKALFCFEVVLRA